MMHLGRTGEAFFLRDAPHGAVSGLQRPHHSKTHSSAPRRSLPSSDPVIRVWTQLVSDAAPSLSAHRTWQNPVAGGEGASGCSGPSAPARGDDAAPGAAIEHVVAAQEAAQELGSLDSAQVRALAFMVFIKPGSHRLSCRWP